MRVLLRFGGSIVTLILFQLASLIASEVPEHERAGGRRQAAFTAAVGLAPAALGIARVIHGFDIVREIKIHL